MAGDGDLVAYSNSEEDEISPTLELLGMSTSEGISGSGVNKDSL